MAEPPAGQGVGGLTSEEEALRHACLKIQNDPRLSASEKRRPTHSYLGRCRPVGWRSLRIASFPGMVVPTAVEAKNFVLYIGHLGRGESVVQPVISRVRSVAL
jgi:hypothetical protein